jgi:hypothetical protein
MRAIRTQPPQPWLEALRAGAVSGTLASILSTATLAWAGRRETGSAAAPVNAVSHWLWGEEALREDDVTWRHTLPGYATQHLAAVFWAVLYHRIYGNRPQAARLPQAMLGGAATSAAAALIDYTIVPKRLTPGYEHRLSTGAMVATFASIAIGIAAGSLLAHRVAGRRPR